MPIYSRGRLLYSSFNYRLHMELWSVFQFIFLKEKKSSNMVHDYRIAFDLIVIELLLKQKKKQLSTHLNSQSRISFATLYSKFISFIPFACEQKVTEKLPRVFFRPKLYNISKWSFCLQKMQLNLCKISVRLGSNYKYANNHFGWCLLQQFGIHQNWKIQAVNFQFHLNLPIQNSNGPYLLSIGASAY